MSEWYVKQNPAGGLYHDGKWTHRGIPNTELKRGKRIRTSGCGQCSTSMGISHSLNKFVHPSNFKGKYIYNNGSSRDIGLYYARKYGVNAVATNDIKKVVVRLAQGCYVMSIQGKGIFTKGGHYIILCGLKNGRIKVLDPASKNRTYIFSGKTYTMSQIDKTCKKHKGTVNGITYMGYTIFFPKIKMPTATVKDGSVGENVKRVQMILAFCDMYDGLIDGKYGKLTEKGIKEFNKKYLGLDNDGSFGPQCKAKARELCL